MHGDSGTASRGSGGWSSASSRTSDAQLLHEVLAVTSRSVSTFIDDTIAVIAKVLRQVRAELTPCTRAERLTTVSLLLEGALSPGWRPSHTSVALTGTHQGASPNLGAHAARRRRIERRTLAAIA